MDPDSSATLVADHALMSNPPAPQKPPRKKRAPAVKKESKDLKRPKLASEDPAESTPFPQQILPNGTSVQAGASAAPTAPFRPAVIGVARSISACHRCRMRKTRCDQKFPSCNACLKAGVECVGIDAATGRKIPRSYVSHLEDRIAMLERQLRDGGASDHPSSPSSPNGIPNHSPDTNTSPLHNGPSAAPNSIPSLLNGDANNNNIQNMFLPPGTTGPQNTSEMPSKPADASNGDAKADASAKPDSTGVEGLMSTVKMVSSKAATSAPSAFLGSSSGLSFARLLLTAIKFNANANPDHNTTTTTTTSTATAAASTSSSQLKQGAQKVQPASLPSKETAEKFLYLFFSQANSQLPVIHREQFLTNHFIPIYGPLSEGISLASDYTTIGVPVTPSPAPSPATPAMSPLLRTTSVAHTSSPKQHAHATLHVGSNTPIAISNYNAPKVTEETPKKALYFLHLTFAIATSIHHQTHPSHISESFRAAAMQYLDTVLASPNRLEALQGILLLAQYSIMRPSVPGIWYVLGWALRLCVDLGMHTEAGYRSSSLAAAGSSHAAAYDPFTMDMRRRLFWCTYAIDRQVCVYLGRPFGIPEESIKVPFPSQLDDTLIVEDDFSDLNDIQSDHTRKAPSYKIISLSFFRIRKIQAEIQRILYDCAPLPREFETLEQWRTVMGRRLEAWHAACPKSAKKMNCNFNLAFIELNYHQTRLLLYGPTPSDAPEPTDEHFQIIADAGEKVILHYKNLHRHRSVNYTWVAVHNLFMAGTSYLYALYHSPMLREATTVEDINFNAHACIEVLSALVDRCDAAVSCRSTFELLTAAILKLCTQEKSAAYAELRFDGNSAAYAQAPTPKGYMPYIGNQPELLGQNSQFQGAQQPYAPPMAYDAPIAVQQAPPAQTPALPTIQEQKPLLLGQFPAQQQGMAPPLITAPSSVSSSAQPLRAPSVSSYSPDEPWLDNFDLDQFFLEAGMPMAALSADQPPQTQTQQDKSRRASSLVSFALGNSAAQLKPQPRQSMPSTPQPQQPLSPQQMYPPQQQYTAAAATAPSPMTQQLNQYFGNGASGTSASTGAPGADDDFFAPQAVAGTGGGVGGMDAGGGPRLFDIINEVPMAAIWDQFFAPSTNGLMMNPHSGDWQ